MVVARHALIETRTLRERLAQLTKPIVAVGGLCKAEKLRIVNDRFGIDIEWHEVMGDSTRATDAIVRRIKAGNVGAIVLLEGLMGHRVSKRVIEACQACNVPLAMGDRAGTGSLEIAFNEIVRRLSV
jgi:hypothetical protein